jgi:hypothetical protein
MTENERAVVHLDDGDDVLADFEVAACAGLEGLAAEGGEPPGV